MLKLAQAVLSRRNLIGASLASFGATAFYNRGAADQAHHSAEHMTAMASQKSSDAAAVSSHRMAHGAMITVAHIAQF